MKKLDIKSCLNLLKEITGLLSVYKMEIFGKSLASSSEGHRKCVKLD